MSDALQRIRDVPIVTPPLDPEDLKQQPVTDPLSPTPLSKESEKP